MIYMENEAIGSGAIEFSDEPGVVEWYRARGWKLVDRPEPAPFIPKPGMEPTDDGWVTLKHAETGATHDFPNNPDALAGAVDVGWEPITPEPSDDQENETPEDPPAKPKKKAEPKPPACNTLKDETGCGAREDCTWVAASIDTKTQKEKRKAYCRSKPKAKAPAKKAEPKT